MNHRKKQDAAIDCVTRWIVKRMYAELDRCGVWHEQNTKRRKRLVDRLKGSGE